MSRLRAAIVEARLDAAVLRQPLLGDVEARHDLDARDDRDRGTCSGGDITGCSTPSMRNRIRISFSYGSMWMSLAPF